MSSPNYCVIMSIDNTDSFENEINKKLSEGYVLHGNTIIIHKPSNEYPGIYDVHYYQPMVFYPK